MNNDNLYEPHHLMIDSGTFWRCKHGTTGFKSGLVWKGCFRCWVANRAHKLWMKIQTSYNSRKPKLAKSAVECEE
jgi:hypothetical protein